MYRMVLLGNGYLDMRLEDYPILVGVLSTTVKTPTEVKQHRACPVLGWVTAWE